MAYDSTTPDWTLLGEIKLTDLIGNISNVQKIHSQGVWTNLNKDVIKINVNYNYLEKPNNLCQFMAVLI